ncbi:MAG TPA: hypothetical protein VEP90_11485, partial [Methylomirabilota bacterium]|nr:hypothetical protein [Methylomirabilota bacterium]
MRERAVEALERIHDPRGLDALQRYQKQEVYEGTTTEDSRSGQMKDRHYLEPRYSNTPLLFEESLSLKPQHVSQPIKPKGPKNRANSQSVSLRRGESLFEMGKPNEAIEESNNKEVSIVITRHYRHLVEFSLVSKRDLYEVLQLYVEIVKMHYCVPSPVRVEAMSFRNNYCLTLVPDFRLYPLLPPTLTNSRDTWVLKGREVDLFGIEFDWPRMKSVEVVVKAEVYNHIKKESKLISSSVISLKRNGEQPTESTFVPEGTFIQMSPYLYKLLTVEGLRDKITRNEQQLNNAAFEEIAATFNCEPLDLINRIVDRTATRRDLTSETNTHPMIASQLLEVARAL